jgi:outer membrane protein TolC
LVVFFRDQALPLAEQNVKGAELVYQAGQEGVLSILESQRELRALRKTYIDVLRDYNVAQAELARAMGGRVATESPGNARKDGQADEK